MNYSVAGELEAHVKAQFISKGHHVSFGISNTQDELPNPAELLLGSFAACCLKNIERFSTLLKFEYTSATIEVIGKRQDKPTKLTDITYVIHLQSNDPHLNIDLLHKNIQKFGTIYNTLKGTLAVTGKIVLA